LQSIFRAAVRVEFGDAPPAAVADDGLDALLEHNGARLGHILLSARPDGIPFLSDDRRLLQSLAGTLSVVLENVRFRADLEKLRWLAGRAELKALRAQINPHFLFNALNAIAGLIREQPQLADETIEQLAQVFRYTLRKSANEWVPLAEEIEFVTAYLRVEQARFGGRLHVKFEIDPAAGQVLIPAMSVQPLVENAIKHGIADEIGGGTVGLRATLESASLRVEVTDNGPGFPAAFSLDSTNGSHGLTNIVERLRGYYGSAARLWWENAPGGTCVSMVVPINQ
jgi:LytS/YehU family sensor histidine kinase